MPNFPSTTILILPHPAFYLFRAFSPCLLKIIQYDNLKAGLQHSLIPFLKTQILNHEGRAFQA